MKNSLLAARIVAGVRAVVLLLCVTLLAGCGGQSQSETSQPSGPGGSPAKHLDAGREAWNNGNKQAAIAAFTKAIAVDPECKKAYLSRAMLYTEQQRDHDAFNDFWKVIELDPLDAYAYDERAKIYRRDGQEAKAKADEKTALAIRGKDWGALPDKLNRHRKKR
ncbi:MAG: tetratricopeptide repeat protein [Candidatus Nealsonbacteria bacterium]|nr:tetratricopeptide repeat protein [Candidatus Nealsonbacteria bacterium]